MLCKNISADRLRIEILTQAVLFKYFLCYQITWEHTPGLNQREFENEMNVQMNHDSLPLYIKPHKLDIIFYYQCEYTECS